MILDSFYMNDVLWDVRMVEPIDINLIDRSGKFTVATTDPKTHTVYLSRYLYGDFLTTVLIHELGHCAMISYGLLDEIHRYVPEFRWIDVEEWICNFLADYGYKIFKIAFKELGYDAWKSIPRNLDKQIRRVI